MRHGKNKQPLVAPRPATLPTSFQSPGLPRGKPLCRLLPLPECPALRPKPPSSFLLHEACPDQTIYNWDLPPGTQPPFPTSYFQSTYPLLTYFNTIIYYFVICYVSPLDHKLHESRKFCMFCSLMYLQHLEQSITHR